MLNGRVQVNPLYLVHETPEKAESSLNCMPDRSAESQTPVFGVAVPYAIANVVLTAFGPIIVALTFAG